MSHFIKIFLVALLISSGPSMAQQDSSESTATTDAIEQAMQTLNGPDGEDLTAQQRMEMMTRLTEMQVAYMSDKEERAADFYIPILAISMTFGTPLVIFVAFIYFDYRKKGRMFPARRAVGVGRPQRNRRRIRPGHPAPVLRPRRKLGWGSPERQA